MEVIVWENNKVAHNPEINVILSHKLGYNTSNLINARRGTASVGVFGYHCALGFLEFVEKHHAHWLLSLRCVVRITRYPRTTTTMYGRTGSVQPEGGTMSRFAPSYAYSICGLFLAFAFVASAQEATIVGTITDPSGAPVPNVKVTISNDETGQTRVLTSNAVGQYVMYRSVLRRLEPNRMPYLAIDIETAQTIFAEPLAEYLVEDEQVRLIVVDIAAERIIEWRK